MFSYFGSKTNLVSLYPRPRYDTIIEPFAGAAKYSLKYFDKDVILIDKYPTIIKVWKYLQSCSVKDIQGLPHFLDFGVKLKDLNLSEEERLLMGFVIGCGAERPRTKTIKRKTIDRPNHINFQLQRIEKDLFKIKHWTIIEGDYTTSPKIEATYFIDPPYQFGGSSYVINSKKLNYGDLKTWCLNLNGQLIICENTKADWMTFKPMVLQKGSVHSSTEAIYTNSYSPFYTKQQVLF